MYCQGMVACACILNPCPSDRISPFKSRPIRLSRTTYNKYEKDRSKVLMLHGVHSQEQSSISCLLCLQAYVKDLNDCLFSCIATTATTNRCLTLHALRCEKCERHSELRHFCDVMGQPAAIFLALRSSLGRQPCAHTHTTTTTNRNDVQRRRLQAPSAERPTARSAPDTAHHDGPVQEKWGGVSKEGALEQENVVFQERESSHTMLFSFRITRNA